MKDKAKRKEKRELERIIEERDARISDLELELQARDVMLSNAKSNGIGLNQSGILQYDPTDSSPLALAQSEFNTSQDCGPSEELKECMGELLPQPRMRTQKSYIDTNFSNEGLEGNFASELILSNFGESQEKSTSGMTSSREQLMQ